MSDRTNIIDTVSDEELASVSVKAAEQTIEQTWDDYVPGSFTYYTSNSEDKSPLFNINVGWRTGDGKTLHFGSLLIYRSQEEADSKFEEDSALTGSAAATLMQALNPMVSTKEYTLNGHLFVCVYTAAYDVTSEDSAEGDTETEFEGRVEVFDHTENEDVQDLFAGMEKGLESLEKLANGGRKALDTDDQLPN